MNKKIMSVILLSSLILVGCVKMKEEKVKPIVLSFAIQDIPSNPSYKGYLAFIKKLNELSAGTMTVELINLTKHGSLTDMFNMAVRDEFDMVAISYTDMVDIVPELAIINAPYVARDYEHFLAIRETEYGKEMIRKIYHMGVVSSGVWYMGMRHITANIPINSPQDLKGLEFRTPPSSNLVTFANALGAIPNSIGFQELHDAMERGEVEAQENPVSIIETLKLYEVQKHIAITGHAVTTIPIYINRTIYERLTEQQKAWYHEALEYGRQLSTRMVYEQEETFLEKLEKERGMMITYPNKNEFKNAMQRHYDELEERFAAQFGAGIITELMSIK